jgi:hypothetical protein
MAVSLDNFGWVLLETTFCILQWKQHTNCWGRGNLCEENIINLLEEEAKCGTLWSIGVKGWKTPFLGAYWADASYGGSLLWQNGVFSLGTLIQMLVLINISLHLLLRLGFKLTTSLWKKLCSYLLEKIHLWVVMD